MENLAIVGLMLFVALIVGYVTARIVARPLPKEGKHARYGRKKRPPVDGGGHRETIHRVPPRIVKPPPAPPKKGPS